jgi:selenocysteine lyase/cysteine desulfurase
MNSFFGPEMELSPTASRFDNSISWLAAVGNDTALSVFNNFGADAIYAHNREVATTLRTALDDAGFEPVPLAEPNRSTIVSVPIRDAAPAATVGELRAQGLVGALRDGNLRLSVHLYNDEADVERVVRALGRKWRSPA